MPERDRLTPNPASKAYLQAKALPSDQISLFAAYLCRIFWIFRNPGNSVASPHATSTRAVHPKVDRTIDIH